MFYRCWLYFLRLKLERMLLLIIRFKLFCIICCCWIDMILKLFMVFCIIWRCCRFFEFLLLDMSFGIWLCSVMCWFVIFVKEVFSYCLWREVRMFVKDVMFGCFVLFIISLLMVEMVIWVGWMRNLRLLFNIFFWGIKSFFWSGRIFWLRKKRKVRNFVVSFGLWLVLNVRRLVDVLLMLLLRRVWCLRMKIRLRLIGLCICLLRRVWWLGFFLWICSFRLESWLLCLMSRGILCLCWGMLWLWGSKGLVWWLIGDYIMFVFDSLGLMRWIIRCLWVLWRWCLRG